MSAPELRQFEVFVNTHTSAVYVEAADAEEAAELGVELLAELLAADANLGNISVTPIAEAELERDHAETAAGELGATL